MSNIRRLGVAAGVAAGLVAAAAPPGASARVVVRRAGFEPGPHVGRFDQLNSSEGVLAYSTKRVYTGRRAGRATYRGRGLNGYARGVFNVLWRSGDHVTYSAAYWLPKGFLRAMRAQVDLLRFDNYPDHPWDTDWGGVSIFHRDRRAHLLRFRKGGGEEALTGPIRLPEGRWFYLSVRQRLSAVNAVSEVYLDGRRVARSLAPNTYGRRLRRVRFGLVAIGAGAQVPPLTLWFDAASIGRRLPKVPKPPPPSAIPPVVDLTSPKNGQTVFGTVHLSATASDDERVARVDFAVDGTRVCSTGAPYVCDWTPPIGSGGRHTIIATAHDNRGLSSSSSVTITTLL